MNTDVSVPQPQDEKQPSVDQATRSKNTEERTARARLARRRSLVVLTASLVLTAFFAAIWIRGAFDIDSSVHYNMEENSKGEYSTLDVTSAGGRLFFGSLHWTRRVSKVPGSGPAQVPGLRFQEWEGHHRMWGWGMAYYSLAAHENATVLRSLGVVVVDVGDVDIPQDGATEHAYVVSIPLSHCTVAAIVPGLVACTGLWRMARRAREGRCRGCGYNLAGVQGSICPECGKTTCA